MDLGIKDKIALVTAASCGLGRGCADQLAAEQCRVAICGRNPDAAKRAAEELAAQHRTEVIGFGADMRREQDIERLLADVRQTMGDPEILVTNAGGRPRGRMPVRPSRNTQKPLT